ncbi:DEAD/DEAH box helicase [Thaumasiovibrio subtropicus]|uniref:DEAD/DEAH box helicase n=2 Tax=Thaumasiovibrio subtropicus TaxID=1891207 RepID=UPI001C85E08A|nr:DEAD/DEAH box helicase [Thaumasiovibrio subtropicus]
MFDFSQLHPSLAQQLKTLGYHTSTPVQAEAIPAVLEGGDVMAGAQTGTGKTAAFALPLLHKLLTESVEQPSSPRVMVVVPTRELAQQVLDKIIAYAALTPLRCVALYGGVSIKPQVARLASGVDVIVGTPGRLLDHLYNKTFNPDQIQTLVMDEADRMLDMGFMPDIKKLLTRLPPQRQTLFFSATYPKQVMNLAYKLLSSPTHINIDAPNSAAHTVEQRVHPVDRRKKRELLSFLIGSRNLQQVLVFTKTRQSAEALVKELKLDGLVAEAIHGERTQAARNRALEGFKNGDVRVLVATDVAARGIDIPQLACVFNYELPHQLEDYVHRIGRTGRAGQNGLAISLVSLEEEGMLQAIETLLDSRISQEWISGYEPDLTAEVEHRQKRGGRGGDKRRLKKQLAKKAGFKRR